MYTISLHSINKKGFRMTKSLGYISLGCAKNLVDTEVMLGLLKDDGYTIRCV